METRVENHTKSAHHCVLCLVHEQDGSRIGCGLLERAHDNDELLLLHTQTAPLSNVSMVESTVLVVANISKDISPANSAVKTAAQESSNRICYVGYATGLEPNLESVLEGGTDCSAANGCGTHIHSGFACTDTTTQGGHHYDPDVLLLSTGSDEDPWALLGYERTLDTGAGFFGDCLETGVTAAKTKDKPFIVHASDGSRVSCGLLKDWDGGVQNQTETQDTSMSGSVAQSITLAMIVALVASLLFVV